MTAKTKHYVLLHSLPSQADTLQYTNFANYSLVLFRLIFKPDVQHSENSLFHESWGPRL